MINNQLIDQDNTSENPDDMENIIHEIFRDNPDYTKLDLESKLVKYGNQDLFSAIARNNHLTSIKLAYNYNASMQNFIDIINAIKESKTIKSIDLSANYINPAIAQAVANLIISNKVIKEIDLGGSKYIGDEGMELIANAIGENTTLQCLGIYDIGITDIGAASFILHLENNRTILKLNYKPSEYSADQIDEPIDNEFYHEDANIDPQLNNSIRTLIDRNNEYNPEQRKFFSEIKDALIDQFKKTQPLSSADGFVISNRNLEVVNNVMDQLSDNSILKKIRDLFLVSKSLSHLPIKNLAEETSIKIVQDTIKSIVKNPDFMMDSSEIKVVNEVIYEYFKSKKELSLNSLIDKPTIETKSASGARLDQSSELRSIS
jgi:hypothetical protein